MEHVLTEAGLKIQNGHFDFPDEFKRIKIDVGLSVNAPQSQIWLEDDVDLIVIGIEPLKSNIKAIVEGSSSWPVALNSKYVGTRVFLVPVALSDEKSDDGLTFYVTKEDPGCSSLLKPKNFEVLRTEVVPVWKLDDIMKYIPFGRFPIIDHLKIDAQGSDLQILKGAREFLDRIFAITVEIDTDEYEGSVNSTLEVEKLLSTYGFYRHKPGLLSNLKYLMRGLRIDVETDDPTFINKNALQIAHKRRIYIFQRG